MSVTACCLDRTGPLLGRSDDPRLEELLALVDAHRVVPS
jgi:hypothetical protein